MTDKLELQTQRVWGWPIATHLFLAGAGAGCYVIGVLASFGGAGWEAVARTGVLLAFPLLAADAILLLLDLGVKSHALRVFQNPGTSWIARGTWIISTVLTLAFVHLVSVLRPDVGIPAGAVRAISLVALVGAILVMVYTGVLLSASRAIGFWNTAMLPLLFVISASAVGTVATLLLTADAAAAGPTLSLARLDTLLIVVELAVIAFYLQSSHRTDEARASTHLLTRGRLAPAFWGGLIVIGLAAPLALELAATLGGGLSAAGLWMLRVAAVCRIAGAVVLPRLILAAGVRAPLRAAGIEFTFPTPALR